MCHVKESDKACGENTTALMFACVGGYRDCVEFLLDMGASVNSKRMTGCTALYLASQGGFYKIVNPLINRGAVINDQNHNGETALFSASQLGFNNIVELLCSKGANVNLSFEDKTSPTFVASQNGHLETVKVLEHLRADINRRRTDGISPLWIACQMDHYNVVEFLVHAGAHTDRSRSKYGVTPLFKAASKGNDNIVRCLLKKLPYTGLLSCGYNPLHVAAYHGHVTVIEVLLEFGVNSMQKDRDGLDAAQLVMTQNFSGICDIIVAHQNSAF
ncbi:uncharacterized protein LOC143464774 isoform X1 [Clavelina lepadiformis]|uniref:uncharacterized protein LOC143464774 isoform X1 n=1 Tax=Clavelina lepadiformis TaxID=159417 RepID=UPI004041E4A2